MSDYDQKFIENPAFLKWIFNSNPSIDQYWEFYLIEHPEEKDHILELKSRLTELKFSNDKLNPFEQEELSNTVINKINSNLRLNKRRLIISSFLKYAAVAIIFTAIGGLLVYLNTDEELFNQRQAKQMFQIPSVTNGPLLITSNGKNVNLKKSNSTVDYSHKGAVVLNSDSVIQNTTEEINTLNQLVIPYGNQSKVVLSDNTVVWLNSGSRLIYPTQFKDKTREVMLFGEAFFEVTKNAEKPFIVKTSDLEIKVLGTQFNVSSYSEDNVIQTVLKEGSVSIRRKGASLFESDILIKPNQMASFNKSTRNTNISDVVTDNYTLWTKGLISFEETDFIRVIYDIERYYNVSIQFLDPQKEIMRISGKLDLKQGRKEAMEYLEKVSLLKFEQVSENQYTIK